MFRSRKTRRPKRGALRRRLGVESMEARLMLSTTALNLPQQELDAPQFIVSWNKFTLIGTHVSLEAEPTEGGFILGHADVAANAVFDSQLLNAGVAGEFVSDYASLSVPRAASAILSNYGSINQLYSIDASQGWKILDTAFDTGGLQPAEFQPPLIDGDLSTNMSPVVVAPPGSAGGPSEGGSIPIHVILADLSRDSGLASNVKSVSSATIEKSIDAAAAGHRVTMSEGAMAGEWARGMVFEIAGGEPGSTEPNLLRQRRDSDSDSLQGEPLSSVELPQDGKLTRRQEAAAQPNKATRANESGQQPTTPANGQAAALAAPFIPSDTTQLVEDAELAANPFDKENPDLAAIAAAAVFDQLGEGNTAVIESAVDGNSWLRSIGTSPLLMVLALERIAALNSRRANRDSRVAATKKLRRTRG